MITLATAILAATHFTCPVSGDRYAPHPLTLQEATVCVADAVQVSDVKQVILLNDGENSFSGIVVLSKSTLNVTVEGVQ